MNRPEPPDSGTEYEQLTGFLDYLRVTILDKTDGFSTEQMHRRHEPSTITLAGMLKHLAFVEDYWTSYVWSGGEPTPPWDTAPWSEDPDWDWHSAEHDDPATLRTLLEKAQAASRAITDPDADRLDDLVARTERARWSKRWVLIHLIEEYARHAGHVDLIAEALDGRTGE